MQKPWLSLWLGDSAIAEHITQSHFLFLCDDTAILSVGQLALYGLTLAFPLIPYRRLTAYPKPTAKPAPAPQGDKDEKKSTTIMQPERTDLDPPKNDPFTQDQLKAYDGTDASKPVYVAIKGIIVCLTARPTLLLSSLFRSLSRLGAVILIRVYLYRNGF